MTEKENLLRAFRMENPEWVPNPNLASVTTKAKSTVNERPSGDGYDWYGVHWRDTVVVGEDQPLKDVCDWEKVVRFPDLDTIDWKAGAEKDYAGIDRESKAVWLRINVGLFERMHALMSFEDTLASFLVEPEAVKGLLEAITDTRLKLLDKIITYYHPDIVCMHDDYGTQRDLFMAPDIWRQFFKPHIKRISDYVKSREVIFSLHSCGKVDRVVGDFVDCGVDSWDSVQTCCDLPAIFENYGKDISFSPTVGVQMVCSGENSPEMARNEMRQAIDTLGAYGGVIPQTSAPLCEQRIMDIMNDELNLYGRDYYKKHPIPPH